MVTFDRIKVECAQSIEKTLYPVIIKRRRVRLRWRARRSVPRNVFEPTRRFIAGLETAKRRPDDRELAEFLCGDLGVANEPRPDHAAYVAEWLSVLKEDQRAVFAAARLASAAAEYLYNFTAQS